MFSLDRSPSERLNKTFYSKVLTPDRIPEFFIPPKFASHQVIRFDGHRSTSDIGLSLSGGHIHRKPHSLNKSDLVGKQCELYKEAGSHHLIIQVENVDESASEFGYSDEENTNADPFSQAALSLTHLPKAQTSYGFCTLLESPHTRRKESLFHSDPVNKPSAISILSRGRANTYTSGVTAAIKLNNSLAVRVSRPEVKARFGSNTLGLQRKSTLDSDTASSTESSPFSSPRLARPSARSTFFKVLSQEKVFGRTFKHGARSAPTGNHSLSTDEGSSTDNSPSVTRRSSEEVFGFPPAPQPNRLLPPAVSHPDLMCCRDTRATENSVALGKNGLCRLSAEYCRENERVRVRLISIEGLYVKSVEPHTINCGVTLCLLPGKAQKQRSTAIRKSRNPIFNEDFFFDGVPEEELFNRLLKVKAVNKMSSMKRDRVLGVCELRLGTLLTVVNDLLL